MTEFSELERTTVYRATHKRRDLHYFLPHPVDPMVLARPLTLPTGARPVTMLRLRPVQAFYLAPMREHENRRQSLRWQKFVSHDIWTTPETLP